MKLIKTILLISMLSMFGVTSFAQTNSVELNLKGGDIQLVNKVDIYPNPTVDILHIKISNSSLTNPVIKLYNIIGSFVEVSVDKLEDDIFTIDVQQLRAGYYMVSIEDEGTQFTELYKFLKR